MVKAENTSVIFLNGTIEFRTTDTKATTGIRWKTVGFTITRAPCLSGSSKNGGYPTKLKYATILLDESWKEEYDYEDVVKVIFHIPQNVVSEALLKAGMSDIKNNDTLYFHTIFQVTHNGKNYGSKKYDLPSITNAEAWVNPDDFLDRFDIRVIYKAPDEPISIQYKTSSGEIIDTETYKESKWVTPGTSVSVSLDTERTYNGKTYRLYKSYIRYYELQTAIQGTGVSMLNGATLSEVSQRKINQRVGGIQFVGIMKVVKETTMESDSDITVSMTEPLPHGEIAADSRDAPVFDITEGIPTTETLYVNVFSQSYLFEYEFENVIGQKEYPITVTKTYHLKWIETDDLTGETESKSDTETVTQIVTLQKEYSYWDIKSFAYYKIRDAEIENEVLPNGFVKLEPVNDEAPQLLDYIYSEIEHLKEPSIKESINLSSETIQGGDSRPDLPEENFLLEIENDFDEIQVRNDMLALGTEVISEGGWEEKETNKPNLLEGEAPIIGRDVLYKSGLIIDKDMLNAVYATTGVVNYQVVASYQSAKTESLSYEIDELSDVTVHTPTVCSAQLNDAKQYCQLISPDKTRKSIVLDQSFSIAVSTIGDHLYIDGYGYRDYDKYTEERLVKMPFDVYIGTRYVEANTWVSISSGYQQFYVPIWVKEGNYTIECKTVSINARANGRGDTQEELANLDRENYVAVDSVYVQVSGRIYGMELVDISDYPTWQTVFRKENSLERSEIGYYSGIANQNGQKLSLNSKYTVPLVKGSHPTNENEGILHTGYATRFVLTTIGEMYDENDYVQLTPSYFVVDEQGKNRQDVDIYYIETIQGNQNVLVKVGSELDLTNIKTAYLGDPYFSVEQSELEAKASLTNFTLEEVKNKVSNLFTFHHILLSEYFRTYVGRDYSPSGMIPSKVDATVAAKSMQKWYGEYYLPSQIYVVPKDYDISSYFEQNGGFTFREDFWFKNGYLILQFDIVSIHNKQRYLSYRNEKNSALGYCNMWNMESFQYEKTDSDGITFSFTDGDYLMYDLQKSAAKDYIVGGTH